MGFDALLGNHRLKQNLAGAFSRNRVSHFYLISGPAGSGKKTLSRLLAAAALCSGENRPCLACPHCRKVMAGTHPDFITIDDPEKKYVPVELIRSARADVFIQPNEADRKIYLFPRAQDMRMEAQNALLKILEEPPAYGVFLLLTDNAEKLLPTVRSRCTELSLQSLPEDILRPVLKEKCPQASDLQITGAISRSGGYLGQALAILEETEDATQTTTAFLQAYAASDAYGLTQVLVPMEKWKRDALISILVSWMELLEQALAERGGIRAVSSHARQLSQLRTAAELHEGVRTLKKAVEYTQSNVSPAAVCGWLLWELR